MRVFQIEISDLKSAVTLLTWFYTTENCKDFLSNEVLYIHVTQAAAIQLEVKVGCPKKKDEKRVCARPRKHSKMQDRLKISDFFSDLHLWPQVVLQPLEPHGCTVSHLKALINFEWSSQEGLSSDITIWNTFIYVVLI